MFGFGKKPRKRSKAKAARKAPRRRKTTKTPPRRADGRFRKRK